MRWNAHTVGQYNDIRAPGVRRDDTSGFCGIRCGIAKDQKAGIARKVLCVVLGLPVKDIGTSVTVEYTQFPDVTMLVRAP